MENVSASCEIETTLKYLLHKLREREHLKRGTYLLTYSMEQSPS
jgi:hypothetical protein